MTILTRLFAVSATLLLAAGCSSTPPPQPGYVAPATAPALPDSVETYGATIGIGDELSVIVFREPDLSLQSVRVDPSGSIELPLLGTTQAAGRTPAQLSEEVRRGLDRYVIAPRVTVNVSAANSRRVTVEGEVNQPGIFTYERGMTLLSAMAVARGTSPVARTGEIAVVRNSAEGRFIGVFDLEAIRAGQMADVALQPGDYVVVGRSGSRQLWRDFLQASPLIGAFTRF